MKNDINSQLEKARSHFYALRLVEAYHIFRRYFDRLPFRPEKAHAEYIGMFVRILSELGKSNELEFYADKLESWYRRSKNPVIAYPLAVVYRSLPQPRMEAARNLFDEIIRNPHAGEYQIKAKMMLAHYYDWKRKDVAACRKLIDSIEEPSDLTLKSLWLIWKAKIFRDEKKYEQSEQILIQIFRHLNKESDWYSFFCAKVISAGLHLSKGELKEADCIVQEVRQMFDGKPFKTLKIQLDDLQRQVDEKSSFGDIKISLNKEKAVFYYDNRRLSFPLKSQMAKLLTLFAQDRFVDKSKIVSVLYDRQYDSKNDDKLIYYHIHSLRNRIKGIGVPASAVVLEGSGYRFVPNISISKGGEW